MDVAIIGAGTAGALFAQELRKLDKESNITIIEQLKEFDYSPCSLPYFVGGEIKKECLFNKTDLGLINAKLITSIVTNIDAKKKTIEYLGNNIKYDKLVLALGSKPNIPKIKGIENCQFFYSLKDAETLASKLKGKKKSIAIIGAGFIGCELAQSLAKKNHNITIIERKEGILDKCLSKQFSEIILSEFGNLGVRIISSASIIEIKKSKVVLPSEEVLADIIIACTGSHPNIDLAKNSGIKTNKGIIVSNLLQTSDKDIYAIGDCAEYDKNVVCGLASTSKAMAKCLANNFSGKKERFSHIVSSISRVGKIFFGSAGKMSENYGIHSSSISKNCFGNDWVGVKIYSDKKGIIVGCEAIGTINIYQLINMLSLAIKNRLSLESLASMDNCYNPSISPLFEHSSIAALSALKKIKSVK